MLAYIVRLDDATPKMNKAGWKKIEDLLDRYEIKPIVGIIPDCKDVLFTWDEDPAFWTDTVTRWQSKGWTIAQHGCHHVYHDCGNGIHSEFIGLEYDRQMQLIQHGHKELKQHGVIPTCFFAPAHTFDDVTVDVCRDSGFFQFISDGCAIYPFVKRNMLFVPNIFDTAYKILPFGVYTFVLHPSFITEKDLQKLESFIQKNHRYFRPVPDILENSDLSRTRNMLEMLIDPAIKTIRCCRKWMRRCIYNA